MLKVIKPSNPFYECLLGFAFTTFSAPSCSWLHRQFSSPNSRNEEMMGDGFPLVLPLPVCFEQ